MKASVVQHSGCTKYNRPCFRGPHQHQNKSPSSNRQGRPSERDMIFCLATEETCQSHADGQCQYQKAGSSSPDYDTEKKPYDIAVSDACQKRCAHQRPPLPMLCVSCTRYCMSIHPFTNTPCTHLVVGSQRYLIFPELKECCRWAQQCLLSGTCIALYTIIVRRRPWHDAIAYLC